MKHEDALHGENGLPKVKRRWSAVAACCGIVDTGAIDSSLGTKPLNEPSQFCDVVPLLLEHLRSVHCARERAPSNATRQNEIVEKDRRNVRVRRGELSEERRLSDTAIAVKSDHEPWLLAAPLLDESADTYDRSVPLLLHVLKALGDREK